MNEPKNNSFVSTIIFLCVSLLIILAIVLFTEDPVPKQVDTDQTKTQAQ